MRKIPNQEVRSRCSTSKMSRRTLSIQNSLAEEVNEILHETLYDLLDESLHNASSSLLLDM